MKKFLQSCLLITLVIGWSASVHAEVTLPNIFSDHMVLQRQQSNKVWGKAAAGEKVSVTIGSQTHSATAGTDGYWQIMLDPLDAGGPHELVVKGSSNTVSFNDVLVGEVWVCSGQSNMQWRVQQSYDADLEVLAAKHPNIRMINFPQVGSQEAVWTHPKALWQVCSPETVSTFSAVGYFFGRQLHDTLDVPIGLINNAWGGSACEAWIDRQTIQQDGRFALMLESYDQRIKAAEELVGKTDLTDAQKRQVGLLSGNARPGNIYNGVLKSHLGYGIRGVIWYQGESNAGRAYQYRELFPLMIQTWRKQWNQGDFPFYWVQLADYMEEKDQPAESSWAELREAQTMTMDKLPKTGQAVIIDIGEGRDIHPRNKVDVGRRLARLALANDYGIDLKAQSPRYRSMEKQGSKIVLSFDHVDGWWTFDVKDKPIGFAIAGEDRQFVWADAKILADGRIEVSSPAIADPQAVRYAWADNPVCNVFNKDRLPLTPFRTDDWPGVTINNN